jgi:hypothetical protein
MEKNNNLDSLAAILAYDQVRAHEEFKLIEQLFSVIAGVPRL